MLVKILRSNLAGYFVVWIFSIIKSAGFMIACTQYNPAIIQAVKNDDIFCLCQYLVILTGCFFLCFVIDIADSVISLRSWLKTTFEYLNTKDGISVYNLSSEICNFLSSTAYMGITSITEIVMILILMSVIQGVAITCVIILVVVINLALSYFCIKQEWKIKKQIVNFQVTVNRQIKKQKLKKSILTQLVKFKMQKVIWEATSQIFGDGSVMIITVLMIVVGVIQHQPLEIVLTNCMFSMKLVNSFNQLQWFIKNCVNIKVTNDKLKTLIITS